MVHVIITIFYQSFCMHVITIFLQFPNLCSKINEWGTCFFSTLYRSMKQSDQFPIIADEGIVQFREFSDEENIDKPLSTAEASDL